MSEEALGYLRTLGHIEDPYRCLASLRKNEPVHQRVIGVQ